MSSHTSIRRTASLGHSAHAPSTRSGESTTSAPSSEHPYEERHRRRPLRNQTPYGRHSNDWLFGSVSVKQTIRHALAGLKTRVAGPHGSHGSRGPRGPHEHHRPEAARRRMSV